MHASNSYLGIIDNRDKRLYAKRLPNRLDTIQSALQPFRKSLAGIVVESTYNWDWLVDGLQSAGFKVHLANPSAIKQYEGLKHTDDQWDSFRLAHMLQLGILPEGYIYPRQDRPIRDLLRRRLLFVRQRSAQILSLQSLQSMVSRNLGIEISGNEIKKMKEAAAENLFDDPDLAFTAMNNISTINFLTTKTRNIEKRILAKTRLSPQFEILTTIPGAGNILGLTIMLGWKSAILAVLPKPAITPPTVDASIVKRLPTKRKRAKAIVKTATNIFPGLMLKPLTLQSDFARRPTVSTRKKWLRAMARSLSRPLPTNWHAHPTT